MIIDSAHWLNLAVALGTCRLGAWSVEGGRTDRNDDNTTRKITKQNTQREYKNYSIFIFIFNYFEAYERASGLTCV